MVINEGAHLIGLLQRAGLTKYEAEAYLSLLREGPLTGYELGKRSAVPLPRAYDVLRRLFERGLARAQPGDPPRYRAIEPALLLDSLRRDTADLVNRLDGLLREATAPAQSHEFWVIRGRRAILDHAAQMTREAQGSIEMAVPVSPAPDMLALAAAVRGAGGRVVSSGQEADTLVLVAGERALLGSLSPPDDAQATVSGNPALLAAARTCTAGSSAADRPALVPATSTAPQTDWLAWEDNKQRRLRLLTRDDEIA